MKQVNGAITALVNSARATANAGLPAQMTFYDLYTITLTSGLVLTYTTANFPIAAPSPAIFSAPQLAAAVATFEGAITGRIFNASGITGALSVGDVVAGPGVLTNTALLDGSVDAFHVTMAQTVAPEPMVAYPNVWQPGMTWKPFPVDVKESKALGHWKVGLDADTWQVKVTPRPNVSPYLTSDYIGSQPWLAAAAAGALDNADCIVSRAFFAGQPQWGQFPASGAVPLGTLIQFRGYLSEVDCTTTSAVLTINDYRLLAQQQMPRNYYMPQCRFRFGSARCGVSLAAYTQTGAAALGSTPAQIISPVSIPNPGGSGTYAQGYLTMTGGSNRGFSRGVRSWDGSGVFGLVSPFPYAVAAGDRFSVVAGCNKSMTDCTLFSNLANFGGDPFIPAPEVSLG